MTQNKSTEDVKKGHPKECPGDFHYGQNGTWKCWKCGMIGGGFNDVPQPNKSIEDVVMKKTMAFWEKYDSTRNPKGTGNPRVIRGQETISKDVVDDFQLMLTEAIDEIKPSLAQQSKEEGEREGWRKGAKEARSHYYDKVCREAKEEERERILTLAQKRYMKVGGLSLLAFIKEQTLSNTPKT
jgi:hypothetical protein